MSWLEKSVAVVDEAESTTMQDCVLGFAASVLALFAIAAAMIGSDASAEEGPEPKGAWHARPVTVLVCCDASSSMQPVLEKLKEALRTLAEIASRLSPKFQLGIWLHWGHSREAFFRFTEIGASADRKKHEGRKKLDAFFDDPTVTLTLVKNLPGEQEGAPTGKTRKCSQMTVRIGHVHMADALTHAAWEVRLRPAEERVVLIVIGDQGCHEIDKNPNTLTEAEKSERDAVLTLIGTVVSQREDARVWSLFCGKDLPATPFRAETIEFFKNIAAAAGTNGRYSDDITELSAAAIEAVFSPPKEKDK